MEMPFCIIHHGNKSCFFFNLKTSLMLENPVPAILQGTRGLRSNICRIPKTMAGSLNKLSSQSFATNERVFQINNVY